MMKRGGFLYKINQGIHDMCYIWVQEMKQSFTDEGVLIFFFLVPLLYPLLYSWIYNNEVVREVPVVAIDNSHSFMSREFLRKCDATPNLKIVSYSTDINEAKEVMRNQGCHGIIYIPSDFSKKINTFQQATVSIYCDMSGILYYKALQTTVTDISIEMGKELKVERMGNYTDRDNEVAATPLEYEYVPMFNPSTGYGSFIMPPVLMLIIQQTLLLGIGLAAGTSRERNRYKDLVPVSRHYNGIFRIVLGKSMCYFMIYLVMSTFLAIVVPKIFSFLELAQPGVLFAVMVPYILACVFFSLTISCLVRYRENVILLVVFTSLPLFFISGLSWPGSNIPEGWRAISVLFPSTFGINAYVRVNSLGANLEDVLFEYKALWVQVGFYFLTACIVYRRQIIISRKHALQRLEGMKKKKKIIHKLKRLHKTNY
jgi:ABC-2 type transport system permease protein